MRKGCTLVFLAYALLGCAFALKFASGSPPMADSESLSPAPRIVSAFNTAQPRSSEVTVAIRASSGATTEFKTQNGEAVDNVPPQTLDMAHLVLYRNGTLTDPDERTLVVEVTGIEVPPPGVTVTLKVETQHGNPDAGGGSDNRILVWRESRWIANTSGFAQTDVSATFRHEFDETVTSGAETIATPTDYFRYDVAVIGIDQPLTNPVYTSGRDYAFLMENQWVARLPEVQETSDGAAPDELIVYYCDMFPFQKNTQDPTTRLPRESVPGYVHAELVPQMVEAFRVQTDDWGFPWHDAWTSFRRTGGQDAEQLSVALADGRTWFHSRAPDGGHAGISITVERGAEPSYDTLTDSLMSTFYHELFHSLQRNISLNSGGNGYIDGAESIWQFFSEGTAVLASTVGQPRVQFSSAERAYVAYSNYFVGGGGSWGDLNISYKEIDPYHAAIYWRFLYEQCGGMKDGVEDPAAGMHVIKRALTALYAGDDVDINSSTDLVRAMPDVMNRALQGSACPFNTYEESLIGFSRAIYALRLDGGRCTAPGIPTGCGFYDPAGLYHDPTIRPTTYDGATMTYVRAFQPYPPGIKTSFGMDFVDVILDPSTNGQPLTIEFYGAPGANAEFNVQIWQLMDLGDGTRLQRVPGQVIPEMLARVNADGHLTYAIPAVNTTAYNRLGLIITRTDANEDSDPIGAYTVVLHPGGG